MVAECFVVEREESLVLAVVDFGNPHGPGEGAAEIVFPAERPDIHKRPLRVERFVREVFVSAAMQRVGAGFDREVEQTARYLAELRRVVTGLERELLNLLDRRLADGASPGDLILA